MYTQPVAAITNPRTSCPHLEALVPFETRFSGQIVNGAVLTLSSTDALLLSGCSIPANVILSRIEIVAGAKLVFNDQDISFSIGEISIASGGSLHAGSETCRLYSKISIQFVGSKGASSPVVSTATSKGIISSGTLSLHGKQYNPTWTRLAVAAKAGDSTLVLQDPVNWEVGQRILVTTSSFFDCPTKYAQWCAPCKPWELSNNNAKCKIPTYYPHQTKFAQSLRFRLEALIEVLQSSSTRHWCMDTMQGLNINRKSRCCLEGSTLQASKRMTTLEVTSCVRAQLHCAKFLALPLTTWGSSTSWEDIHFTHIW